MTDDVRQKIGRLQQNDPRSPAISFSSNNLSNEDVMAIAVALQNNPFLQVLSLHHCQISDSGASALAIALQHNTALEILFLFSNQISEIGASTLAKALRHNTSLRKLWLGFNKIGDAGASALAEALRHNTSLQELHLMSCGISNPGASALAKALENNTILQELDLSFNVISDVSANVFVKTFDHNRSLLKLDVTHNTISAEVDTTIQSLVERNKQSKLSISVNSTNDTISDTNPIAQTIQCNFSTPQLLPSIIEIDMIGATSITNTLQNNPIYCIIIILGFILFYFLCRRCGTNTSNKGKKLKKIALVIGNSEYGTDRLINPCRDADAVFHLLESSAGFCDVQLCKNLSGAEMRSAVEELQEKIDPDTVVCFYFAGHGFQVNGVNYVCPVDDTNYLKAVDASTSLSLTTIYQAIIKKHPYVCLMFIDACRNHLSRGANNGPAPMNPKGHFIAFSCGQGEIALDMINHSLNSPFTTQMIKYLSQNEYIEMLMSKLIHGTAEMTNDHQHPTIEYALKKTFNLCATHSTQ